MNSLKNRILSLIILVLVSSCQTDESFVEVPDNAESTANLQSTLRAKLLELYGSLDALILPNSEEYTAIPNDPENEITQAKVTLGKLLFHETELGIAPKSDTGRRTYSCASCHHAKAGFQSGIKQGIGEGGWGFGLSGERRIPHPLYDTDSIDVQPIRTPTILNVAYQDVMLWNGQFGSSGENSGTEAQWTPGTPKEKNKLGFQGVETQAIAGLGVHRLSVSPDLIENGPYKNLFDEAFPNIAQENRYSLINAGLAIATFERTVLANEAPFQKFLKGDTNAMTDTELKGARLFFGKGQCYQCHSGPGLNGMDFHALGMNDLSGDIIGNVDEATAKGRGGFTKNPEDDYKFKTPTLYNLKDVAFLGHGGSFESVKEIIDYKNEAIPENNQVSTNQLDPLFVPLNLTEDEVASLTVFVEHSLYDGNLDRYVPDSTPMGTTCFPNADIRSLEDLDCN
ncbi:Di-heme cytochrome c peroxidase [Croceitalea dokdonensis DOKDO 023]|uniref:Di-heme cytochrome c peroxidase n=1 Tax=Croceitalea dokdonensis DOKDO 023 TaxID=1300341 RepID=A0A0P7ATX7_9FLAO|nr:cytochrome c peroxidase [Croceitalea dokdonensis]KPM31294.1 Di-heme cytochrome c peroxidase [Croceitalea dokdonensis DOKDO 023]